MIRLGAELDIFHVWENAFGGHSARTNDGHLWVTSVSTNPSIQPKEKSKPLDLQEWFHAVAACDRCELVKVKPEKRRK